LSPLFDDMHLVVGCPFWMMAVHDCPVGQSWPIRLHLVSGTFPYEPAGHSEVAASGSDATSGSGAASSDSAASCSGAPACPPPPGAFVPPDEQEAMATDSIRAAAPAATILCTMG
jgi:hypothetical protein